MIKRYNGKKKGRKDRRLKEGMKGKKDRKMERKKEGKNEIRKK